MVGCCESNDTFSAPPLTRFWRALSALTGIVWVTQALRQVDLLTSKGQSLVVFSLTTGLHAALRRSPSSRRSRLGRRRADLPQQVATATANRVVMSASGVSPGRLLRPFFVGLFALISVLEADLLHRRPCPGASRHRRTLTTSYPRRLHRQSGAPWRLQRARAGSASTSSTSRERGPRRLAARNLHARYRRDPAHTADLSSSEMGKTSRQGRPNLPRPGRKGSYLSCSARFPATRPIVTFEDYAIDLSQFTHSGRTS